MDETLDQPTDPLVHAPTIEDLPALRGIMEQSLIDATTKLPIEDEIEEVLGRLAGFMDGDNRYRYLVAYDEGGKPVGMMGVTTPDEEMKSFAQRPEECVELINAFTDPAARETGVARLLVDRLKEQAALNGATEVVVNSGLRYKDSGGWKFWTGQFGEGQTLVDRYGPGIHAKVWRGDITPTIDTAS